MKNKKKNNSEIEKNVTKNYQSKESSLKHKSKKKLMNEGVSGMSALNEPVQSYSISSKIRPIGNSKGVILPNRVIEEAGISPDADLIIQVAEGLIIIAEAKSTGSVNTDLSSWDEQFKKVIKLGNKSEPDLWGGMQNSFDEEGWT